MSNVQFQEASFFSRREIAKIQTTQNVRVSAKNDIAEVLSVGVDTVVNSYEAALGEVTFFGKTAIKLLYNDGVSVVGSNYTADLAESVQNSLLTADSKCVFDVVTMDVKVQTSANVATITVLSEVTVFAYVAQPVTYFADSDNLFLRTQSIEVATAADVQSLPFPVEADLVASTTISGVLMAESTLCIKDYVNAEGVLKVSGDAAVRLTYQNGESIVADVLPFKFSHEFDAATIPPEAQLVLTPFVKGTKVRLDIAEDSQNTEFSVEIAAILRLEQTVSTALTVVNDAYGTDCDFVFRREKVQTTLPCGSAVQCKRVSGTVADAKDVLAVTNVGALVTDCISLDGHAQVEGVLLATALFRTENGIESTQLELPFIQTVDVDFLAPQCASAATVAVTDFSLQQDSSPQYSAVLCITVDAWRNQQHNVIASADEKPFDKTQLSAIEVCLAHKGETLWELAKGLHMSEDDLLAVNPEISTPLQKDARIVVYNKI